MIVGQLTTERAGGASTEALTARPETGIKGSEPMNDTKKPRRKYRYPDRAAAEDALAIAEQKVRALAQLAGDPDRVSKARFAVGKETMRVWAIPGASDYGTVLVWYAGQSSPIPDTFTADEFFAQNPSPNHPAYSALRDAQEFVRKAAHSYWDDRARARN